MPITQSRMLAVLAEAQAAHDALAALREGIISALDSEHEAPAVVSLVAALLVTENVPSMTNCAVEREHFRRVRRRNEANAQYMAHNRANKRAERNVGA